MSDNHEEEEGDFEEFLSQALIEPFVRAVLQSADPELGTFEAVKRAITPIAAQMYVEELRSGAHEHQAGLTIMMLGYAAGFEAGHIDGHICAEGFVPDTLDQMFFDGD